ncbi:nuclear transport factor 2 family protein [Desulfovibrio sp. JY]|nr:nuclear transport factor 2 family protein [Desulfovibrio sp. JY]
MEPMQEPITGSVLSGTDSPIGALSQFYFAFNRRDMNVMRQNWNQRECVLFNPLGGVLRGWSAIEPLYMRLFNGPAKVYVEFFDYTIHIGGDLFFAAGRERGEFEKGTVKIELAIRTSRIYKKRGNDWKQIHHHGSIEDPQLLETYRAAVFS